MAKKKKDKLEEEPRGYDDHELEKKVDAMMSVEPVESDSEESSPKPEAISTAPLLEEDKEDIPTEPPQKIEINEPKENSEEQPVAEEEPVQEELPAEENLDQTIEELQEKIQGVEASDSAEISQPADPANTESSEVISESDAIDDIVASESDNIMNVEDRQREALNQPKSVSKMSKFWKSLASIFTNPKRRKITFLVTFLALAISFIVPTSRYYLLNTFGVRSASSVKVLDEKTLQPLKNVEVSIGSATSKTDKEGNVYLSEVKLGSQELIVKKPAFAQVKKTVVIGWGSNPLGEFKLNPVGSHYNFNFKDFLSAQPIKGVEVETDNGEFTAISNEKGEASLVVEDTKQPEIKVKIRAEKLRDEDMTLDRNDKQAREVAMVPANKHAFVSKRSGKYDLYSVYIDGKDEQKLIAGSGYEKPDGLMISPALESSKVAFITTKDNNRNKDGFLLSSLYLVDVNDKSTRVITKSERIQIIGWFGPRIVYVKVTEGASAESSGRHKLMTYNISTNEDKELASANYFNDVLAASGSIYFAPTSFKSTGALGLFRINPDGTNKQSVIGQEVWNILRQNQESLNISVGQQWYEYGLGDSKLNKLPGAPATTDSKVILDNTDNHSALIDQRDGKGVLLVYDKSSKKDKQLVAESGLANPIYWLGNDTIVFRISNSNEIADYAISVRGGEKKKIASVTNTAGIDRWYYY